LVFFFLLTRVLVYLLVAVDHCHGLNARKVGVGRL
jgi:hypothetical protein